jgi:hypothetical protein
MVMASKSALTMVTKRAMEMEGKGNDFGGKSDGNSNKEGKGKGKSGKSDGYCDEEGNGDGSKIDGDSNKEGKGKGGKRFCNGN